MIIKPFHISIATRIIDTYEGRITLKHHLNNLFKENKNWGSKDRKIYRDLCYKYYRLGYYSKHFKTQELIRKISEDFNHLVSEIKSEDIFPLTKKISEKISIDKIKDLYVFTKKVYLKSLLNNENLINDFLTQNSIEFEKIEDVFVFKSEVNIEKIIQNGWGIVMDLSSQQTVEKWKLKGDEKLLDVCCGAGGKSIYLKNKFPQLNITNLDVRESILKNFSERYFHIFKSYPSYNKVDMSKKNELNQKFDAILADVPCSGSGTWGRTPENILFFDENKISEYQKLQQSILMNSIEWLKPLGKLCFITCSIFKAENEENVKFITDNIGLNLINEHYINEDFPYSDFLYCAEFEKV